MTTTLRHVVFKVTKPFLSTISSLWNLRSSAVSLSLLSFLRIAVDKQRLMPWYKWARRAKTLRTDWLLSRLFPVCHDAAVRSIQIEKNRKG